MAKPRKTTTYDRVLGEIEKMKHRELQRACVVRGLSFDLVVSKSDPLLTSWLLENWENGQNAILLNMFDAWKDEEIKKVCESRGETFGGVHPHLRLGYIGETNEITGKTIIKRPKGIQKPKKGKRERDEKTNLFKGTKKALTASLAHEGIPYEEIVKRVKAQFPEAQDKSIRIWWRRVIKEKEQG